MRRTSTIGYVTVALALAGCADSPVSPSPLPAGRTGVAPLTAGNTGGQPVAVLSYQSDPGDYIGQGQAATFHLTREEFGVMLDPPQSELRFSIPFNGSTWWNLNLKAPAGSLAPGIYNNATRYPFQQEGVPGLDFSGSGRGCNTLTGRFGIVTAQFSGTEVRRFHARFEQHCEGFSVALRGQIWIDASGAPPPPLREFPRSPWTPTTFFSYQSAPGDYVGQGGSGVITLKGMKFVARQSPNGPGVQVYLLSTAGPFIFWSADFTAPSGTSLLPGKYPRAARFPSSPEVPGLDVSGNGRGCNALRGSFIVHEANYGPSGEVLRFHATFEQHCEGAVPALLGEVRIVADPWR